MHEKMTKSIFASLLGLFESLPTFHFNATFFTIGLNHQGKSRDGNGREKTHNPRVPATNGWVNASIFTHEWVVGENLYPLVGGGWVTGEAYPSRVNP